MAINLSRNSKVFFTLNIDATTGVVQDTGYTPTNTYELQILDGFTFSQNTNSEAVTVSEGGTSPVRSQRSFNTSLAPVDFSFSTYLRPYKASGAKVTAEENVLWNALLSSKPIDTTPVSVIFGTSGSGSITGGALAYTQATGKITVTGTGFTVPGTISAGDTVVLSGITPTGTGSHQSQFNALATLDATITVTGMTFTLVNNPNLASITLACTSLKVTKVANIATGAQVDFASVLTGIASTAYAYDPATGIGTITFTSSGTTFTALGASSVNVPYVLTGIVDAPKTYTVTPGLATAPGAPGTAVASNLNVAVYLAASGDSTTSSLKLTFYSPEDRYTAMAWDNTTNASITTVSLAKAGYAENLLNAYVSTAGSDQSQLQKFGMLFLVDNVAYAVDNCALTQVTVDYGIDQITMAQWSGQGTALRQISTDTSTATSSAIFSTVKPGYFSGTTTNAKLAGAYKAKNTSAPFLANRLTNVKLTSLKALKRSVDGTTAVTAGKEFSIAVTGGNFTINNNITYLTPTVVSVVNTPATYFTGTRAITGSVTAYLRTGAGTNDDIGYLLDAILDCTDTSTEPMFLYKAGIGGAIGSTTAPYIQLTLPTVFLQVPTIDVQQVVSSTINFTAQGTSTTSSVATYDVTKTNDANLKYFAV